MNQPPNGFSAQGAPPPPPPSHPKHYCFSGSPTCSGCVPCAACLVQVRTFVLPPAMAAAGFAGDPRQAQAFFDAYTRQGWPGLHQRMNYDPALQQRFAGTDILAALQELEMLRANAQAHAAAPARPSSMADPASANAGGATGSLPAGGTVTALATAVPAPPWMPGAVFEPNAVAAPGPAADLPSGTWIQEMTADDVAAAGEPLPLSLPSASLSVPNASLTALAPPPPPAPNGGVVLGNVMVVPPGYEVPSGEGTH